MKEHSRVLTGAMLGALAGGVMAFLAFTGRGRTVLRRADAAMDEVSLALDQVRSIVREVDGALQEVRPTLAPSEVFADRRDTPRGR